MKRQDVLLAMLAAGYHNDSRTWTRLVVEHRVSRTVAREQWAKGVAAKARGIGCNCADCKSAPTKEG